MKVRVITVGKLKDKYYIDAAAEYQKRLSRFCKTENIVINDKAIPEGAGEAEEEKVKKAEGDDILKKIGNGFVVALCVEGKKMTSEQFAALIDKAAMEKGEITFVIGGSLGLSDEVKKRPDIKPSMSDMTFPHRLAYVVLLEQIFRGFKINAGETYHK